MRFTTVNKRTTTLLISMLAVLVFAACGGETEPTAVAQAPTTVPPTATQVIVEVTVAPIPTETPIPTAKPEPTPKPPVELTKNLGPELLAASKAQPMVDFPIEITKGSPILEKDQVLEHWTEFLVGTRSFGFSDSLILEYCPGGEGTWVYELGSPNFTGAKFDYELQNDPGGSWNSVVVVYSFRDKTLFDLMGGAGNRIGLQGVKDGEPSNFHEAITCGTATSSGESFTGEMINTDSVVGVTNYPEGHPLAGQDPELTNTLSVVIEGTIESAHLGSGTVAGEVTIDLTGLYTGGCTAILEGSEGTISFTAEDGDVLDMVMTTNQLCGATGEFTGVYDIVGGTGKFATADGVITASSFPVEGEPSVNTLTGTIDY